MATHPFTPQAYKALCFDIYGTLIDWETGITTALSPLFSHITPPNTSREFILSTYTTLELATEKSHPTLPYNQLLASVYRQLCTKFSLELIDGEDVKFGASIGTWAAFPDTVAAMQSLAKRYKLIALSNVDISSFSRTLSGPLAGVNFDAIYTAEEIGSYKPDIRNFEFMLKKVKESFGVEKEGVWVVAGSLMHDHRPAKIVGLGPGVWIDRKGSTMAGGLEEVQGSVRLGGVFETLGKFAEAVEGGFEGEK